MIRSFIRPAISALALSFAWSAFGAEGQWTEGFGQGNYEYFADSKGMRLYIGCPTGAEAYASVALLTATTQKEVGKFAIRVAGRAYDGPFEADSRAGASNFMSLLADLRKADAVVVYGGKTVTFPKSNAAKVLPVYGKKFHCNLG